MKRKLIKSGDLVQIEWHDARFFPNTYTKKECLQHQMCLFKSLGYFLSRDDITTRIPAETNNEGEYRDITLIPTGSIVSIVELSPRALM